jgi:hypothetical protein
MTTECIWTRDGRTGRPLLYTASEALVLVLIGLALIASAALPAVLRQPHAAQAYTKTAGTRQAPQGR